MNETFEAAPERRLLDGIDWYLLRDQKLVLLEVIKSINDPDAVVFRGTPLSRHAATSAMDGIVNLIDAVQDTADAIGLVPADAWLTEEAESR